MESQQIIDVAKCQPEKQVESVARVQDAVNSNAAPLGQLVEADGNNDGDLYALDDSDDDDDMSEVSISALDDEMDRAEIEPYINFGEFYMYSTFTS
jgi:hypothetical protein